MDKFIYDSFRIFSAASLTLLLTACGGASTAPIQSSSSSSALNQSSLAVIASSQAEEDVPFSSSQGSLSSSSLMMSSSQAVVASSVPVISSSSPSSLSSSSVSVPVFSSSAKTSSAIAISSSVISSSKIASSSQVASSSQMFSSSKISSSQISSSSKIASSAPAVNTNTLGAVYTPSATVFSLWSPDTANVQVKVNGVLHSMQKVADFNGYTGVYQATVAGDLHLAEYNFVVNGVDARDPYGKMAKPGSNSNIVMDMSRAALDQGWAERPAFVAREDAVIYEIHVRDFTIDASSGVSAGKRGKYLGMVESGTSINGVKTGI